MGIMLLLTGIGFLVLLLSGVLRPTAAAQGVAPGPAAVS
jgi:hypothetical protein